MYQHRNLVKRRRVCSISMQVLFLLLTGMMGTSSLVHAARFDQQTYPFQVQTGTPAYLQNFANFEKGCNWMGVAGQVFDRSGQPINRLVVQIEGILGNQSIDALGLTGLAPAYGPGGFEIELAQQPQNTTGSLNIALYNLAGEQVSEWVAFNTVEDCNKNLVLINFQETGTTPVTPTPTLPPSSVSANGRLLLQGRPNAPNPAWVMDAAFSFLPTVQSQAPLVLHTMTDAYGNYTLSNLPSGAFQIAIKGENTLRVLLPVTMLQAGANPLPDITLLAGDANDDNFVSAVDFSLLASAYGQCLGTSSYNGKADFNNDQCVSAADFSLLSANYGKQGQ